MARRTSKVVRYRTTINFNIGMIVFLVLFLYLAVNVFSYLNRGQTKIYEVGESSSVVQDNTYTALILRSETVQTAPEAGYVNFYIREGSRTSAGSTVYSVDTNGAYTSLLSSGNTGGSSLTSDQLTTLKTKLSAFTSNYSSVKFSDVYDLKYSLQNLLLGYIASDSLDDLEELGIDADYLRTVEADHSGIVEYYTDGYETAQEDRLTLEDLSDDQYEKNQISSGTLVEEDAAVFKTITSEEWFLYLPLTEEDRNQLADQTSVTLLFPDVNLECTADFSLMTISDGTIIGKCTLSQYMLQLADRRYTNVTLKKSAVSSLNISGLKIPRTSVLTKEFYVVPVDYATTMDGGSDLGFIRETYTADGTVNEFITPTIYSADENYYFLDRSEIEEGTVLRKPTKEVTATAQSSQEASSEEKDEEGEDGSSEEEEEDGDSSPEEEEEDGDSSPEEEEEDDSAEEEEDEDNSSEEEEDDFSEEEEDGDDSAEGEENPDTLAENMVSGSYTIGTTASLSGVYNVNKGYAVFRPITVLDESDDYYIVSEGESYGLSVYDHILLDGSSCEEGELIY